SPGMLPRHYAPRGRLVIWRWSDEADLRRRSVSSGVNLHSIYVIAHDRIPSGEGFGSVSVIPHDAEAFARSIYAELHRCDERGAKLIIIEQLPQTDEWRAIADRLNRAAAVG